MKKMNYESPEFNFNEMKLVERVANVCWGTGRAFMDNDMSGTVSEGDLEIVFGGGCQGKDAAEAINNWYIANGYGDPGYGANVCNTNTPGIVAPSVS